MQCSNEFCLVNNYVHTFFFGNFTDEKKILVEFEKNIKITLLTDKVLVFAIVMHG